MIRRAGVRRERPGAGGVCARQECALSRLRSTAGGDHQLARRGDVDARPFRRFMRRLVRCRPPRGRAPGRAGRTGTATRRPAGRRSAPTATLPRLAARPSRRWSLSSSWPGQTPTSGETARSDGFFVTFGHLREKSPGIERKSGGSVATSSPEISQVIGLSVSVDSARADRSTRHVPVAVPGVVTVSDGAAGPHRVSSGWMVRTSPVT